ncbi:hypothetical protein BJ742DRAFT_814482 [Cladochytrium replicatum]|nr:hypothetical protein BJ742DRAFT_814482 [Cladochytrium replicatum]
MGEIVEVPTVLANDDGAAAAPAAESGEISMKTANRGGKKATQDTTDAKYSKKDPKRTTKKSRALEKGDDVVAGMDPESTTGQTTRLGRKPVVLVHNPPEDNSNESENADRAAKKARSTRAKVDKREEVEPDASKVLEKKVAGASKEERIVLESSQPRVSCPGKETKSRRKKKAEAAPAEDAMEVDDVVECGEREPQKTGRRRGTTNKIETKAKEGTKDRAGREAAAKEIEEEKDNEEESEHEIDDADEDGAEGMKATVDLYAEFGIGRTASQDEIKKAYRKLALQFHPDKVKQVSSTSERDAKEYLREANEKFQTLSKYYEIISNPTKRARYDATGIFDEEGGASKPDFETFEGWYDHFRSLWERVTSEQIDAYEKTYKGSKEQEEDIIEAYEKCKGSMDCILEHVPFATPEDEEFIMGVVKAAIEAKTIASTKAWKSSTTTKERKKRLKELEKEHAEFEQQNWEEDLAALGAVIRKKGQDRMEGVVEALEKKYGSDGTKGKQGKNRVSKAESEPSEEEFLALRKKMDEERAAKGGSSAEGDKATKKRGGKSEKDAEEAVAKKRKSQDDEEAQIGIVTRGGRKKAKAK